MQEEDKVICPHCGKPIEEGELANYDILTDQSYHADCWQEHRLDEVADAYNKDGVKGLERIEREDELDAALGLS